MAAPVLTLPMPPIQSTPSTLELAPFWKLAGQERRSLLLQAIYQSHSWHYTRNLAYRHTVSARGVGEQITESDLPRLLRPTSQTFKSYIDRLGTPFAQDKPAEFLEWLAEQISIELPTAPRKQLRPRYASLEALLADIERTFSDYGFELSTSSGTSGRSTIMIRDRQSVQRTVESFYLSFQRYLGMRADHRAIFIMPQRTRIAMARMAAFSVQRIGLEEERIHFTIPYPAHPDQVRVRGGRSFRSGWRGEIEKRLGYPFMNWANDRLVTPNAIRESYRLLKLAQAKNERVLLFGGWSHLHILALQTIKHGLAPLRLAQGSLLGTGGGFKEFYPYRPEQIRQDVAQAFCLEDGRPIPLRDVYGMAEANWAAMQCANGSYHLPPWIYAITLDQEGLIQLENRATGMLAFFDPFGGGSLFPAFFRTADQVELVGGGLIEQPELTCPCGEPGAYITQNSIRRADLMDEAGCAAQL